MIRGRALRAFPRACLAFTVLVMLTPLVPAAAAQPLPPTGDVSAQEVHQFVAFDALTDDHFGNAVSASSDIMAVGAPMEDNANGTNAGSVYVYVRERTGWDWDEKLIAPDGAAQDNFGTAVATYGDTLVVGAPSADVLRGSVYVFRREAGAWPLPYKLVPVGTGSGDHVGMSVAVYQDTALIGSWGEAAYVYTRGSAGWTSQAVLTDPASAPGDWFGLAVGLHRNTAIVGAYGDGPGSASVFVRSGSSWSLQQTLVPSDGVAGDGFGQAVSVWGDSAIVGAPLEDSGATVNNGAAYIFTRSGSTWTQQEKRLAGPLLADETFGGSVSISGDTALIGGSGAGAGQGRVFLEVRRPTGWETYLQLQDYDDGDPGDRYGCSVSAFGGRLAVGEWGDDISYTDSGSAWFYLSDGEHPPGCKRYAGSSRYLTAVATSQGQFRIGAPTVVIATGENWPDALGGSALCGAVYGPMLLTPKASLPAEVIAEIKRLGASRAYVLGGTSAVSKAVEDQLVGLLGRPDVVRLAGTDRYTTARAIADEVIRVRGSFDGHVLVATGGDFPDATALAPVAAYNETPIVLANPTTAALSLPAGTSAATIAGGTSAVPASTEAALVAAFGDANVTRYAGVNRYDTAARIAQAAVEHGMLWNGMGLASGTAFPDALSGGVMLGCSWSVLLLTPPDTLSPYTRAKLEANVAAIHNSLRIIGGTAAVSTAVETQAKTAAGITP